MTKAVENPMYITVTPSLYRDKWHQPVLMKWNAKSEQYEVFLHGPARESKEAADLIAKDWAKARGVGLR